jgi:hypothetical protein
MHHFGDMENIVSRRKALTIGAATFLAPQFALAGAAPIIVELFTSQGCSSCPAADKFAAQLKKDPNVMVLSLNVDYWDYLGWKDTLAHSAFTKRQMDYAHERGDMDVYTPQMIINGAAHVVGSNESVVKSAVIKAQAPQILKYEKLGDAFNFNMPKQGGAATLWALTYEPSVTVEIKRGENNGKTITYHNVVRHIEKLGTWDGKALNIQVPMDKLKSGNTVITLQANNVGQVLGIAQLTIS